MKCESERALTQFRTEEEQKKIEKRERERKYVQNILNICDVFFIELNIYDVSMAHTAPTK